MSCRDFAASCCLQGLWSRFPVGWKECSMMLHGANRLHSACLDYAEGKISCSAPNYLNYLERLSSAWHPIIRCLLSHLWRAIANTTQTNFHDGHTELDTICILQVTLSSYANSCLQTLRRNMTKLWAPQCPNKKSSFQRFGLQHSSGKCSQWQLSAGPRYHRMMHDVQPGTGTVATVSTAFEPLETEVMTVWWNGYEQMEEKWCELVQEQSRSFKPGNLVAIVELHCPFLNGQLFLATTRQGAKLSGLSKWIQMGPEWYQ